MIQIEHLHKQFGNKVIYDDFNVQFEDGKIYGIAGKSGSGKSTLLNILGLIDTDYEGNVIFNSMIVNKKDVKQKRLLLKDHIFYLFQNYALVDDKTVEENFDLVLKINPKYRNQK